MRALGRALGTEGTQKPADTQHTTALPPSVGGEGPGGRKAPAAEAVAPDGGR